MDTIWQQVRKVLSNKIENIVQTKCIRPVNDYSINELNIQESYK